MNTDQMATASSGMTIAFRVGLGGAAPTITQLAKPQPQARP